MPRFFFDFCSPSTHVADAEGDELLDLQAAVNEAKQVVWELSRNRADLSGYIRVSDEGRRVVHREWLISGPLYCNGQRRKAAAPSF